MSTTTARTARLRTLPRGFDFTTATADELCRGFEIAQERARAARPGSNSSTYWINKSGAISRIAFDRGFTFRADGAGGFYWMTVAEAAAHARGEAA